MDPEPKTFSRKLASSEISFMPEPDGPPQIPVLLDENSHQINTTVALPPPPSKWGKKPSSELGAKIDRFASIAFPMVRDLI